MEAFALALMDRIRPAEDACASQPVKPRRAAKALLNVEDSQTPAVAVSWQSVELARAAIIAIAVAGLAPLDLPLDHGMPSSTPHSGSEVYRARGRFSGSPRVIPKRGTRRELMLSAPACYGRRLWQSGAPPALPPETSRARYRTRR